MSAATPQFIGRVSELEKLKEILNTFAAESASESGLKIVSVSGCGGVGKTYLLDSVLAETGPGLKEALILKVDASNEHSLRDFALIVDQMLAPRELPPPALPKHDYFPAARSLLSRQLELIGLVESEISNNKHLSEQAKTMRTGFTCQRVREHSGPN
jgi:hypothetical protein